MINTVVVVKHTTGVPETSSLPMQVHSLGHLAKEFAEWFWKTVSEEKKRYSAGYDFCRMLWFWHMTKNYFAVWIFLSNSKTIFFHVPVLADGKTTFGRAPFLADGKTIFGRVLFLADAKQYFEKKFKLHSEVAN